MKRKTNTEKKRAAEWLILLSPFLFGFYFPWGGAIATGVLLMVLFLEGREKGLQITGSPLLLATAATLLFLLLGMIRGTDRGMAIVGAVQFLPLPLFMIEMEQHDTEARFRMLRGLPTTGAVMTLLSFLLSRIPSLSGFFLVNGRLSGFFQYPNSYGVWLLLGLCLLLFRDTAGWRRAGEGALLVMGILLSGSRSVWLLTLAVLLLYGIHEGNRKKRTAAFAACAIAVAAGAVMLIGKGRLSLSTFYGRLLYAQDALPVILRHPLGLGYLGYSWLQGSFQTGIYTTVHVHNELLQLLLDAGWIPAALLIRAVIRSFRAKDGNSARKLMLAVLCLHCLFDFDTQFLAIAFVFLTLADTEPVGERRIRPGPVVHVAAGLLLAASLWIGTASLLLQAGRADLASAVYPGYTTALVQMLQESDETEKEAITDRILKLNPSAAIAHEAKAETLIISGQLQKALEERQTVIRLCRYELQAYLNYLDDLQLNWEICRSRGDNAGMTDCRKQMQAVPVMLEQVKRDTSGLGRKIQDQPQLELPPKYRSMILKNSTFHLSVFLVY